MSNRARAFIHLAVALLALSCAAPPPDPLAMRVTWGLNGTSILPSDVTDIEIVTCVGAGQADEVCTNFTCSVNALSLMTESEVPTCRPRAGTEMFGSDPVLVRTGLATYTPLRFELHGKGASGEVLYVGQAGPFVLGQGQRRFIDLRMYEVGRPGAVAGADVQRLLHTATRLPDGRILIAGGFTRSSRLALCPEAYALPEDTRCFDLSATNEALAFDPSSGSIEPVRGAMLASRGGHTATALPDGRVLVAGGAPRALLAMVPQGAAAVGGYAMLMFPQQADGSDGAHDTFEVFDAFLDAVDDAERDGDLGRGRFLGAAGQPTTLGPLGSPRFLHAAAQVPSRPERVVLVGGMGGTQSAATWEVFDSQRAGGYGVYPGDNRLSTPRVAPGAVGIRGRVWIFGGALATDDSELAEIWTSEGTNPSGRVSPANESTAFPSAILGAADPHPEYSLLRPIAASVDEGSRALVIGWYGPQCEPGATAPQFADASVATEFCNSPGMTGTRSFTVNDTSGLTASTPARPRALGAMAEVGCFKPDRSERYVVLTGGAANASWVPQSVIDVFGGSVDSMGAAQRNTSINLSLASPRMLHTSTGIPGFGIVTVGGLTFSSSVDTLIFQSTIEVVYLPSPDVDDC